VTTFSFTSALQEDSTPNREGGTDPILIQRNRDRVARMACVAVICSPRHEGQFKPTANLVPMASEKTKTKKIREEKEEGTEWDCVVCTFKNAAKAFKCAICDTRKPSSTRKNSIEMGHTPTQPTATLSPSSKPLTPSNKKTKKTDKDKKKGSGALKRSLTDEGQKSANPSEPANRKAKKEALEKETKKGDSSAGRKKREEGQKTPSTPVAKETEKPKKNTAKKEKTKSSAAPKTKTPKATQQKSPAKPPASKKAKKEPKIDAEQGSSSTWNCPACTFENRGGAYKCAMCDTRKGSSTRRSSILDEAPKGLTSPSEKKTPKKKTKKVTIQGATPSATPGKSSTEKKRLSQGARTTSTPRVVPSKKKVKKEVKKEGKKEVKKVEKKEVKKEEKEKESTDETPAGVSLVKNGSNGKSGFAEEVKVIPIVKKTVPIAKKKPKMELTVDKKKPEDSTGWDCIMCTFKNKAAAYKCEMCNTKKSSATRRSSIVEEISRKKNTANSQPAPAVSS
ncbi:hypothetical protein PMAYCL1PPCAC_02898, partial [Pristionchus mayeri]